MADLAGGEKVARCVLGIYGEIHCSKRCVLRVNLWGVGGELLIIDTLRVGLFILCACSCLIYRCIPNTEYLVTSSITCETVCYCAARLWFFSC